MVRMMSGGVDACNVIGLRRVRDGPTTPARDEGRGRPHEGALDGLQAPGHGAGPLATARWRASAALVRAGISFVDGVRQEGKVSKPKARAA